MKFERSTDEMSRRAKRPENDPAEALDEEQDSAESAAEDQVTGQATATPGDDDLAALQAKAEENWERFLRVSAELENVRKRAARDIENAHKYAIERFSTDLLAVRDSLELALLAGDEADVGSFREGTETTLRLLTSVMQRFGIEELDPLGEPFDPERHEAMTMQPSADAEPGSILTVFQKGYALNGRLLRPARVVVAAEPAENDK
jgi:molecular chaperone GrpE